MKDLKIHTMELLKMIPYDSVLAVQPNPAWLTAVTTICSTLIGGILALLTGYFLFLRKLSHDRINEVRSAVAELLSCQAELAALGVSLTNTHPWDHDYTEKHQHWEPFTRNFAKTKAALVLCHLAIQDDLWESILKKLDLELNNYFDLHDRIIDLDGSDIRQVESLTLDAIQSGKKLLSIKLELIARLHEIDPWKTGQLKITEPSW